MNRKIFRETLILIIAAIIIGFLYTFITKQGLFSEQKKSKTLPMPDIEMISLNKAKAYFDSSSAIFVDSRLEFEYKQGHIRGAVNVALKEFDVHRSQLNNIPKDKLLITYCDGAECSSSIALAVKLIESGSTNVKVLFGGWQEWSKADFPIEE